MNLPFHATESEKRIIRELLQTAALRENTESIILIPEAKSAPEYIAQLKAKLFPLETKLATERTMFLKPLQTDFMRTSFDQTLETATLNFHVKIRSAQEYARFTEALASFDFVAWSQHCEAERAHAD